MRDKVKAWTSYFRTSDPAKREEIEKIPLNDTDKINILEAAFDGWDTSISSIDGDLQFAATAGRKGGLRRHFLAWWRNAKPSAIAFHMITQHGARSIDIVADESVRVRL